MASQSWAIDADSYIDDTVPDNNYGGLEWVQIIYYTGKEAELSRGIHRCDFSGTIPAGSTINTAVFRQTLNNAAYTIADRYIYYRCRRYDWVEDEVTWNIYKTGSNWGTPGASSAATDVDTAIASEIFENPYYLVDYGPPPVMEFDIDVKAMVIDAIANYSSVWNALCFRQAGDNNNDWQVVSKIGANTRLIIDWTPPGVGYAHSQGYVF